jgi:hypothetical protein
MEIGNFPYRSFAGCGHFTGTGNYLGYSPVFAFNGGVFLMLPTF